MSGGHPSALRLRAWRDALLAEGTDPDIDDAAVVHRESAWEPASNAVDTEFVPEPDPEEEPAPEPDPPYEPDPFGEVESLGAVSERSTPRAAELHQR